MNQKSFPQPPEPPAPVFLSPDHYISTGTEGIPIGAVMAFAGILDPTKRPENDILLKRSNWWPCDGKQLRVEEYPELFEVLGYVYGGREEFFKIPDYGGYFLRGAPRSNDSKEKDLDMKNRTPPNGGTGGTPEEAGSIQDDALQKHKHEYSTSLTATSFSQEGPLVGFSKDTSKTEGPCEAKVSDSETRPKNIYVHFIIKVK
jgi:microcystin-dependent protein